MKPQYNLIDLPEVISLAKKYLSKFDIEERCTFINGLTIEKQYESDLCISNYAFSELKRDVQDVYLEKVIKNATRGYITWNKLGCERFGGYSVEELLAQIADSRVIEEKPLTAQGNCIIVWDNNIVVAR